MKKNKLKTEIEEKEATLLSVKTRLKEGIKDAGMYAIFCLQKPSHGHSILAGREACRATFFNKDVVIKMPKTKGTEALIKWWIDEGIRLFNIKNKGFYEIEQTDDCILLYYYLHVNSISWNASTVQWLFFPGYNYFKKYVSLYKKILKESNLNERRACVVASYIICRSFNSKAMAFGNKFPFVATSHGSLIVTKYIDADTPGSAQCNAYSVSFADYEGMRNTGYTMLYMLPYVDIDNLSFDKIYYELIKQIETAFYAYGTKGTLGWSNREAHDIFTNLLKKIARENREKVRIEGAQGVLSVDLNILQSYLDNKVIKDSYKKYKEVMLKAVASNQLANIAIITKELKEIEEILETSNS